MRLYTLRNSDFRESLGVEPLLLQFESHSSDDLCRSKFYVISFDYRSKKFLSGVEYLPKEMALIELCLDCGITDYLCCTCSGASSFITPVHYLSSRIDCYYRHHRPPLLTPEGSYFEPHLVLPGFPPSVDEARNIVKRFLTSKTSRGGVRRLYCLASEFTAVQGCLAHLKIFLDPSGLLKCETVCCIEDLYVLLSAWQSRPVSEVDMKQFTESCNVQIRAYRPDPSFVCRSHGLRRMQQCPLLKARLITEEFLRRVYGSEGDSLPVDDRLPKVRERASAFDAYDNQLPFIRASNRYSGYSLSKMKALRLDLHIVQRVSSL
ncbi:unnamed protein product [Soboliphyme baturini]|uniref:Maelstrom domain-containing protein n=1 Tax=Soboliphyme baturini TaxID=241478 RepID=A0A183ILR0_9BILA|nr:unnamed protein product [Soboliphyme baturini]